MAKMPSTPSSTPSTSTASAAHYIHMRAFRPVHLHRLLRPLQLPPRRKLSAPVSRQRRLMRRILCRAPWRRPLLEFRIQLHRSHQRLAPHRPPQPHAPHTRAARPNPRLPLVRHTPLQRTRRHLHVEHPRGHTPVAHRSGIQRRAPRNASQLLQMRLRHIPAALPLVGADRHSGPRFPSPRILRPRHPRLIGL